jgi:cell division transport system ATP-binding protein
VFQDYKLIKEWTIEQNIMLPLMINGYSKDVSYEQALKLLNHVKLSHRVGYYPAELSGGEQQRIAVARAIAHNPKIILADEPTGNLDDYSAEVVWNLLKGANEQLGITVVVVTHRVPKNFGLNFRQLSIEDGVIYEVS